FHKALREENYAIDVRPCWRPDRFLHIGNSATFAKAINALEARVGHPIPTLEELEKALSARLDFFVSMGAKAADHGLDHLRFANPDKKKAEEAYGKGYRGEPLSEEEIDAYESYLLLALAKEYKRVGFVQQYHIGAIRNNSKKGFALHGPDFGYDAVGDWEIGAKLAGLLSCLEENGVLPKTIIYCLNPKDYASALSILNCFQGYGKGYLQLGAAWWFNDHLDGIREQLRVLMAGGLLSNFVGMLTDSRSFLSYPRHEYFRRILCDEIAKVVEEGRYPYDEEALGKMIRDICYNNAVEYFAL
ncbi:MAG: glucuronate isomerase, partial [Bacilli bacterium]|nr:glucuronate isomerase [Bacilli bacterium]